MGRGAYTKWMAGSLRSQLGGLGLLVGAATFVVHVLLRSLATAGVEPEVFALRGSWIPINALGVLGAILVLLGLPGLYARIASATGLLGLLGVVSIAIAWLFFGVFLSLYSVLILPWLAQHAPELIAAGAPLPPGFMVAFAVGLLAWLAGAALLAVPLLRGKLEQPWVGYLLGISALWMVFGNLILAPRGPSGNLAINLLSSLGPVLLLAALAKLGASLWAERRSARR